MKCAQSTIVAHAICAARSAVVNARLRVRNAKAACVPAAALEPFATIAPMKMKTRELIKDTKDEPGWRGGF